MTGKRPGPIAHRQPGAARAQASEEIMMNDSARLMCQPRRARPSMALTVAALVAVALLAAACGGSPSATGGSHNSGGSVNPPSAVAYAHCMRSHGAPNYPDPGSNSLPDGLPKVGPKQLGISSSQFQAAQQACQHLFPTGGSLQQRVAQCAQNNDCSPALVQQMMTSDLKLARCMRSHGVPNFPDPTNGGSGTPFFPISRVGISEAASRTHQFVAELDQCAHLVGDNAPESFG